jgi:catechol 2,3-dioxygenase-like lactoylglutathione lyase family enzyme
MVGEGYDGTHPDLPHRAPGRPPPSAPSLPSGGVIDHLGLQVSDVAAAAAFYTRVFDPIGLREAMRYETPGGPVVGFSGPDGHPQLWLSPLAEGTDRPVHLALRAPSRQAVDEVVALARDAGAEVLHEPRVWPEYHPGYYGAFFRDPDGNNVEAVHHTPPGG